MTNIFTGNLIRLRGVEPEDWDYFYQVDQESEMGQLLDEIWFPNTKARAREWTEARATRQSVENDEYLFMIETLAGVTVGTISTHAVNKRCGTFRYGVAIHSDHRRKGYGAEAIRLVLNYYFNERRYQKVTADVYSFNTPSMRLHERLGFTLEGCLRRMIYTGGEYHDVLVYGMTREEFTATIRG
jgi:RimJ/RimL family protein N-acetyltransferase